MAKDTVQNTPDTTVQKIQPVIETKNRMEIVSIFEPRPGFYHFVRIDPAGKELPGTDFEVGPNNAGSYINRADRFKLKKSPTKA